MTEAFTVRGFRFIISFYFSPLDKRIIGHTDLTELFQWSIADRLPWRHGEALTFIYMIWYITSFLIADDIINVSKKASAKNTEILVKL